MPTFRACLQNVCGAVASILFPAPCRLCGELLDTAAQIPICSSCLGLIQPLNGTGCSRCGRPFASRVATESSELPLCHLCRRGLYDFDFARSYGPYTPSMAGAIMLLKYQEVTPLAKWFATVLRKTLPCRSYLLVRSRPRPDKLRLTLRERWRSVRGAYTIRHGLRVDNLRILLVDDVLTTGATLDACSRALRKAGATRVVALTVARAIPRREEGAFELPRRGPDG